MALTSRHFRNGSRIDLFVATNMRPKLEKHWKHLGYDSLASFLRCLISKELRAPRLPHARSLLGPKARTMALRRPRPGVQ